MSITVITAIIALLQSMAPSLATGAVATGTIARVVDMLITLVPAVIRLAPKLYPVVKNIIMTIKSSGKLEPAQIEAIEAVERAADAEFDAALAKAEAEDSGTPQA